MDMDLKQKTLEVDLDRVSVLAAVARPVRQDGECLHRPEERGDVEPHGCGHPGLLQGWRMVSWSCGGMCEI